ncbi:SapC family protein [Pseudomonas sp. DSP3-2-2]|uniref:SapC family protein n=1 Tax=unclassified Pseudomonas TaxID=196821 RepID=UPI003CF618E3
MSYVPVSSEVHKDKRWLRHPSMAFAKKEIVTPIFVNELVDAIHTMPVAFVRHEDRFVLVAVMGLRTEENLLLTENNEWLGGAYIPLSYRARPFQLLEIPDNKEQQVLCIEESNLTDGMLGEALFGEDNQIAEGVSKIFKLLTHYNTTRFLTEDICAALAEQGLIQPWELTVHDGETQQPLTGLYRIDETALNAITDEAFLALRKAAAFPVIYAQLLSMNNIVFLSQLLVKKTKKDSAKTEEAGGGTFSFAGL